MRAYLADHPEHAPTDAEELDALVVAAHRRKSEIYVELVEAGRLPGRPGVRRLVGEALEAGWTVAVASTSAEKSVRAVLAAVIGPELYERVAAVYAGDVVPAKKPAPDIYDLAVRELGVEKSDVVVVEDSEAGAKAAAAAGLTHVVTLSHFTHDDDFPAAALVVEHLGEADRPSSVVAGADVLGSGIVDVAVLDRLLATDQ